ncbi:MAG: hypothetical protein KKI08_15700, partial [Armatimonadetes bacterium]|nr:hypothetical protein [Armatimonadota bacterium]
MHITSPDGVATTLHLNADGYLERVEQPQAAGDPAVATTRFTYTSGGLLTGMADPRAYAANPGSVPYQYQYDAAGLLERATDPAGGEKTLSTSPDGLEVTFASRYGLGMADLRETTYRTETTATGELLRTSTFPGGFQTWGVTHADGTQEVHYADGTAVTVQPGPDPRFGMLAPLAEQTVIAPPDPAGPQLTIGVRGEATTDPNGDLQQATYETSVNGRTATRVYDAVSLLLTEVTPEGQAPSERTTVTQLDGQGRVAWQQQSGLHAVQVEYYPAGGPHAGKLQAMVQNPGQPDERRVGFVYNGAGYLSRLEGPEGLVVTYDAHDGMGRPRQVTLPGNRAVELGYDVNGNLTRVQPPGRPDHLMDYTATDQLGLYTAPPPQGGGAAMATAYQYTPDRRLARVLRPDGREIDYQYAPSSGLLEAMHLRPTGGAPAEITITADHNDPAGRLLSLSRAVAGAPQDGVTTSYGYNGSLLLSTTWSGAVSGEVRRSYDDNFWTDTLTVADAQGAESVVAYGYDDDGQVTQAGDLAITPHSGHGLVGWTQLGDVGTYQAYNGFGELLQLSATHQGSTLYAETAIWRDGRGRITQRTETYPQDSRTYGYTYDAAGRLWQVTRGGAPWAEHQYDDNGNRTTVVDYAAGGGTFTATYDDQDRLLTYAGPGVSRSYSYTDGGELLSMTEGGQTTTYDYDAFGNLTAVVKPDGTTIHYLIDGANRRVGRVRTQGGQTTAEHYLYQDSLNPVALLDAGGNLVHRYVYATRPNVPDYVIDYTAGPTPALCRIVSDHLGSPRLVVRASDGAIMQEVRYSAFGRVTALTVAPTFVRLPFGFAGGLTDPDTGLVRFGARDYDPLVGRWTAKDPIRFTGGDTNLYGYALADPVNRIDPSGKVVPAVVAVAAGVVIVGGAIVAAGSVKLAVGVALVATAVVAYGVI